MAVTSKRIDKATVRRAAIMMGAFCLAAAVMVMALARLQIIDFDYYQKKVLDQMTVSTEVNPERGVIYDRNGNILAANITNYLVCISPQDIINTMEKPTDDELYKKVKDPETGDVSKVRREYKWTSEDGTVHSVYNDRINELIATALSEIIGVSYNTVIEKEAKRGRLYEVIDSDVAAEVNEKVTKFISETGLVRHIYSRASTKRTYPYGTLASQVIGFVNKDGSGIAGIERYYNNLLEGTSGRYISAKDAHSNDMPFEYESYIDPSNGYYVETTLDTYIQYELENQLKTTFIDNKAAERTAGVVMNVNTGEIYAMGTYPTFDLNSPYTLDEYSQATLDEIEDKDSDEYKKKYFELLYRMWQNKAVTDLYEPGSTFKAITSVMAFDEGVVTVNDQFYCPGYHMVDGYGKVNCHKTSGHGSLLFPEGLQQSCNPVFMTVGERLGTDKFYDYFLAFGYGDKTGIDLPAEASGIISSKRDFTGVSLAVYSFGQTFKTTLIQQARAIAAVANGGYLVVPHVLKSIKDSDGNTVAEYTTEPLRQVISSESSETVTKILEEGVSGNGGAKNNYVKGYKVAGKTGTSEKRDKYDENGNRPYRVGSSVAYAPAYDPEIVTLIIVDEPMGGTVYGSTVAAPYVSNLLSFVLPYLGYEPEYTDRDLEKIEVTVPDFTGAAIEDARSDVSWRGLTCEIVGDGDTITHQVPAAGEIISQSKGRVILYTGAETPKATVAVPDLVGKTAEAANRTLLGAGLNVRFTGSSGTDTGVIVLRQSIEKDTMVAPGTVVEIELRYMDGTD